MPVLREELALGGQGSPGSRALRPHGPGSRSRPGGALGLVAIGLALLPWRLALIVGRLIGGFVGSVLRIRRVHVQDVMRRGGLSVGENAAFAGEMYRSLGESLVELLWLAGRPGTRASKLAAFDDESRAQLDEALARGRGVVLATGHTGNWELAAAAIAEAWPLTIVAKRMSVGSVDRFITQAREARGIEIVPPAGAMARARAALGRGGIVGMMIDQVPDRRRHSLVVDFLCGDADVDRSPAALAASTGAPLVVAAAYRDGDYRHCLEVIAVLEPPAPARGGRSWVDQATREATHALDRWIHKHPWEWLWLHRRWRRPTR